MTAILLGIISIIVMATWAIADIIYSGKIGETSMKSSIICATCVGIAAVLCVVVISYVGI